MRERNLKSAEKTKGYLRPLCTLMATPRHKSAEATQVKPPKQFEAKVFKQEPAINEVAQLFAVGHVFGSHDDCWKQAKALGVKHPVLQLKELDHVQH